MSPPVQPLGKRLLAHVSLDGDCWTWVGNRQNSGYGVMVATRKSLRVHRVAHQLWIGPIPDGWHVDHLCRNRACINPDHLEAVTQAENNRRAGAVKGSRPRCGNGHEYTPENTGRDGRGYRICKACRRINSARARSRRNEEAHSD